ncbi:MAG: hypothetical protein LUG18_13090 [Candidatus Azobacteroides sp.]|nr:hypothetical protein [Candidatus Azobacteroides sp.]
MNKRIELHQERNLSEKLSDSFAFIKQNFKGLMKPMLYVAIPLSLLSGYALSEYFSLLFGMMDDTFYSSALETTGGLIRFAGLYGLFILCLFVGSILLVCIVYAYVSLYEEGKEKEIPVFKRVKERVWRFIGYNILYGIITSIVVSVVVIAVAVPVVALFSNDSNSSVAVAVLLLLVFFFIFFVALIFFSIFYYILQTVIFFEDHDFKGNISRTLSLLKGNWWNTAGYLFISSLIMQIGYGIFYIPLYIVMMISAFGIGMGYSSMTQIPVIISSMIASAGMFLLLPLMNLLISFQYYNLAEKKDGTGLLNKLGQLGTPVDESDDSSYL